MKTSLAALTVFLLVAAVLSQSQNLPRILPPTACCVSYLTNRIPLKAVTSFEFTNERCNMPAVIFTLRNSLRICADPQAPWAQELIRWIQAE